MTASGADADLDRLLRDAGSPYDAGAVRALLDGLSSAPDTGTAGDEALWPSLVAPDPGAELRQMLLAMRRATPVSEHIGDREAVAERVARLRGEMKRQNLTGFVVPRADEHQGEYVPLYAQRLLWLTGFSGSAGVAIVLAEDAAIFVDGRYTLQVRSQVPEELIAPHHVTDSPPQEWLAAHLPKGGILGYDPHLHTEAEVGRLRAACQRAGGTLKPVTANPVDRIWSDRPPAPLAPVVSHPIEFAGCTSTEKRETLAEGLRERGCHAAVLSAPDSIAWLLNIRGGDVAHTPLPLSFAILRDDGQVDLFIDRRKVTEAAARSLGNGVTITAPTAFDQALRDLGKGKRNVLVDAATTPVAVIDTLSTAGAALHRGQDPCTLPKARKNAREIAGARAAHERDAVAVCRFLAWLARQPAGTVTELAAEDALLGFRREVAMFRDLSFPTISGAGPNGAIVHYRSTAATNRTLGEGELYLVDSGAQFLDGTTDITRTVAVGKADDAQRDAFTRVLKGHIAIATARFPKGTSGGQLDALARLPLWQAGLDFDHGTGHGIGSYLGVHEGPQRISKAPSSVALEPGMIVSNEPGYYKTGAWGIRTENLLLVAPCAELSGAEREMLAFETLTLAPIDRSLIDRSLLSPAETAWLNAYHARVSATVGPALDDPADRDWLETVTAPL